MEVTQVAWAGESLRPVGAVNVDESEVIAQFQMAHCSVLYLRSGHKLLVKELVHEIERRSELDETQREVLKRFKREMRQRKAGGERIDLAFAEVWQDVSCWVQLSEGEQATLYQTLVEWTKRWLK